VTNEQEIIELATYKLNQMKWGSLSVLTATNRYWHQDVKLVWPRMTIGERSWYILFVSAVYYSDWDSLQVISPSEDIYQRVRETLISRMNSHARDIVNITFDKWAKLLKLPSRRTYKSNFTARDIPVDINEQIVRTVRSRDFTPMVPAYDGPRSGPVKKIDPVQHLATRKPDQRLGVRLEYDSPKVSRQKADKEIERWVDALDMEQE